MSETNILEYNLPHLQNLIKRDKSSYRPEVRSIFNSYFFQVTKYYLSFQYDQQYRRYKSNLEVFLLQPEENSKLLSELTMFIAQVTILY